MGTPQRRARGKMPRALTSAPGGDHHRQGRGFSRPPGEAPLEELAARVNPQARPPDRKAPRSTKARRQRRRHDTTEIRSIQSLRIHRGKPPDPQPNGARATAPQLSGARVLSPFEINIEQRGYPGPPASFRGRQAGQRGHPSTPQASWNAT